MNKTLVSLLLSILLGVTLVSAFNIEFESREDGDELIDEALVYSAPTAEPMEHSIYYTWEASGDQQRFTQIVAVVPDTWTSASLDYTDDVEDPEFKRWFSIELIAADTTQFVSDIRIYGFQNEQSFASNSNMVVLTMEKKGRKVVVQNPNKMME